MSVFAQIFCLLSLCLLANAYTNRTPHISIGALHPTTNSLLTAIITRDRAADPWILAANDGYYLLFSTAKNDVEVYYSQDMSNFENASGGPVWTADGTTQQEVWAPELHYIDGRYVIKTVFKRIYSRTDIFRYYIYVAIDDGNNNNHRMHVLEGDTEDPLLPFTLVGKLSTPDDNWAIDGTVLRDVRYFTFNR